MKKSVKNKVAIMLALFGTIGQKTYANKYVGGIIAGVAGLGVLGIGGYLLLGGKSKDENNKDKIETRNLEQQQNLEKKIKDFFDRLPKDNKRISNYLTVNAVNVPEVEIPKVAYFRDACGVFEQYFSKCNGGQCVSSQEDLNNNKLLIKWDCGTDIFVLENESKLKIQLENCMEQKVVNMTISRPSRNPNVDDPLKNRIESVLDNGKLDSSKPGCSLAKLKRFYDQAYYNNGYYQFDDENVSEKDAVSIVKYEFDDDDSDNPKVESGTIYKFILESEKSVKVQCFKFEANKKEKMDYECVVTI